MPSPFGLGQGNEYQRVSRKFNFRGLDVAHPVDRLGDGRFPYIRNLRAYSDGELRSRPGLASIFTLPTSPNINTLARLNDPSTSDYLILAATTAGGIYGGNAQAQFTSGAISTGHSGSRLTIAEMRPSRSPQPWLYVADSTKTAKLNQARVVRTWGIPEVPAVPTITATPPKVLSITEATSTTELAQTWNNSVNAGALSVANRTNTTITYIVYDSGTTGYCAISPAAMGTDIQPGCRIRINSGGGTDEYVVVEQVFALIASTTIESISYDTGSTGLCWIQLATPTAGLVPNCILRLAGAENVRVLEVVIDKDNKAAIRCSTTATRAATNTVAGLRAFRCSTVSTHAAAETLTASYIQSTITYPGVAPAGVGNIRLNALRDLSKFTDRPVTDDDEVVVTLYLSDASQLVEGRVWFDIDPLTVPGTYAADDLSRNYLFYVFRPEDLQSFAFFDSTTTQVSATATNIQRAQFDLFNTSLTQANQELEKRRKTYTDALDQNKSRTGLFAGSLRRILSQLSAGEGGGLSTAGPETPGPFQAGSGKEQWFTLRFKISQLQRVGQDISRTLKDVTSVMVNFTMRKDAQVVRLSSWYISGGSNPDMKGSDDLRSDAYYYIIQGRDDRTGARSLPSPPTRSGVVARRQSTTIQSALHPNAQVNKLDIYRWGGSRFEFLRLGSMDNTGSPSFVDNFSDDQLGDALPLEFKTFAPTPTVGLPFSCVVNTVGPKVTWVSGTQFNTKWAPGMLVEIAGRTYILYGSPTSATVLYLTESAGTLTSTTLSSNSPVALATPLPVVIGPYGTGFSGQFLFLLGDPLNPHLVYWTTGNDADTMDDRNFLEVSTPGIPLVGGTIYDGRPYLWSTEGMSLLTENRSPGPGEQRFSSTPIANSRGAVSPTGICSDVYIYFVGKDGIYRSEGGQPSSITDDSLYPLFPHDGIPGVSTNGISAPDYTRAREFNLTTYGPLLYFDYPGLDGSWHTLLYDTNLKAWLLDEYLGNGLGVTTHYGERGSGNYRVLTGGTNGIISAVNSLQDLGLPIPSNLWTPCYDGGDERAQKEWGDQILDFNSGGLPLSVETWKDNFSSLVQPVDLITTSIKDIRLIDFLASTNGAQKLQSRNLGLKLSYLGASGALNLYSWQPSFLARPENITLRATDWDYGSKGGAEFFQAIIITADTGGIAEVVQLEFDQQAEVQLLTINHPGLLARAYAINPNVIAHHARLRPTTPSGSIKIYSLEWITESVPEAITFWSTQDTGFDSPGWKHVRECWITLMSIADATLTITLDQQQFSFTLPATGGIKKELYLPLVARKCRIFSAEIISGQPLRLFERDTIFNMGVWGRGDSYKPIKLFGGSNAENLSQAYV
jgi:hypothetical protein